MMTRGTILVCLAVALAPVAQAQKLRSAEEGSVPLKFDAFAPAQSTVTVKPNETAWSETVRPAYAVRLLDASVKRSRPTVEGVPAGTLLFAYRLSTGYAYCPPLDIDKPTRDVQCYRDLDNDGKFDGGYVTGERDADNPYFSSFLKGLTSVPKYRYETAWGSLLPPAPVRVVFVDMKDGAPRFRLHLGRDSMDTIDACAPISPGVCEAYGVRLSHAAAEQNGAITLSFQGADSDRAIDVTNLYDPLKN